MNENIPRTLELYARLSLGRNVHPESVAGPQPQMFQRLVRAAAARSASPLPDGSWGRSRARGRPADAARCLPEHIGVLPSPRGTSGEGPGEGHPSDAVRSLPERDRILPLSPAPRGRGAGGEGALSGAGSIPFVEPRSLGHPTSPSSFGGGASLSERRGRPPGALRITPVPSPLSFPQVTLVQHLASTVSPRPHPNGQAVPPHRKRRATAQEAR